MHPPRLPALCVSMCIEQLLRRTLLGGNSVSRGVLLAPQELSSDSVHRQAVFFMAIAVYLGDMLEKYNY